VSRIDVVVTGDTPIGDVHGDPQELADLVEVMEENGEPVPDEWLDLLEEWRLNNTDDPPDEFDGRPKTLLDLHLEGEFHLRGTADDHDQQSHAGRGGARASDDRRRREDFKPLLTDDDAYEATQHWANPGASGGRVFDRSGNLPYVEMTRAANRAVQDLPIRVSKEAELGVGLLRGMRAAPLTDVPHYRGLTRDFDPKRGLDALVSATPDLELAVSEYLPGRGEGALIRFEPGAPHREAQAGSWYQIKESIISGRFSFTLVNPNNLTDAELHMVYDLNSGEATPVYSAVFEDFLDIGSTEQFHLRGTKDDHDQQSHAGGRGIRSTSLESFAEPPDGFRDWAKDEWVAGYAWMQENGIPEFWGGANIYAADGFPVLDGQVGANYDYPDVIEVMDRFREEVGAEVASGIWSIGRRMDAAREQAIKEAISMNEISLEDAVERWGRFEAAPERGEWLELPDQLYHATSALSAIANSGVLKTRSEIGGRDAAAGLGGGTDEAISFTSDRGIADEIARSLFEVRRAVTATNEGLVAELRERSGGWWPEVVDSARAVHGIQGGMPDSIEGRYNLYRTFVSYRERKEGVLSPMFFNVNPNTLAKIDPADIGVVTVAPAVPGAKGWQVSALGEWRTPTGRTTRLLDVSFADDPETFHLRGTEHDHDQTTHARRGLVARSPEGYQVGVFNNVERTVSITDPEHVKFKKRVDNLADGIIEELDGYRGFMSRYPHPKEYGAEVKASLEEMPPEIAERIDTLIDVTHGAHRLNEPITGEPADRLREDATRLKEAVKEATSVPFVETFQVPPSPPTSWSRDPDDKWRVVSENGQVEITNAPPSLADSKTSTIMDAAHRAIESNPVLDGVPIKISFDHSITGEFGAEGTTLAYVSAGRFGNDPTWREVNLHAAYITDDRSPAHLPMGSQPLVDGLRFTVMHELGHTAAFERSRIGNEPFDDWANQAIPVINDGYRTLMSAYGKTSTLEAHAEAFAEWANTGGTTNNPVVQWYANQFGWSHPASADIQELALVGVFARTLGIQVLGDEEAALTQSVRITDLVSMADTELGPIYEYAQEGQFHLQGQHDQKTHGRRYGPGATPEMAATLDKVYAWTGSLPAKKATTGMFFPRLFTRDNRDSLIDSDSATDRALGRSVQLWAGDRVGLAHLRDELGRSNPDIDADLFREVIRNAAPSEIELHRGMTSGRSPDRWEAWNELEPGDTINLDQIGSFSESQQHANNFGRVRLVMRPGARALPIEAISNTPQEREWLVAGDVRVVSVTPTGAGAEASAPPDELWAFDDREVGPGFEIVVEYIGPNTDPDQIGLTASAAFSSVELLGEALRTPLHLDPNHPPATEEFHLQGQHDQKTHGRRYTATGDLREPDSGFTVDPVSLRPIPEGFAVAIGGSDRLILASDAFDENGRPDEHLVRLTRDRIEAAFNTRVPRGTKRALGAWHNPDDGKVEVNVTVVFPRDQHDRAASFALGNDQIAMFSIHDGEVIMTGGTGGTREEEPIAASGHLYIPDQIEFVEHDDGSFVAQLLEYMRRPVRDPNLPAYVVPCATLSHMQTTELAPPTDMGDYVIRHEIWKAYPDAPDDEAVEMHQAYTHDGAYIGPEDWALQLVDRGIVPELRTPTSNVCSIGFCDLEQKWYDWSHRAMFGFAIGDVVEEGDVTAGQLPVGFVARNLDDAKRMAVVFADEVG
jgi:hypothetical protein